MSRRARRRSARPRIEVHAETDPATLCLECGLCCDGTIFSDITLKPDEREHVEALGLTVETTGVGSDQRISAPQPCTAFVDGCCSLYEVGRPATCGAYTCGLLRGYAERTAERYDCLAVIGLVRSLARELEDAMQLPTGAYSRAGAGRYLREHRPHEHPDEHAEFLVAFQRLVNLGVKYFGYQVEPDEQAAVDSGGLADPSGS